MQLKARAFGVACHRLPQAATTYRELPYGYRTPNASLQNRREGHMNVLHFYPYHCTKAGKHWPELRSYPYRLPVPILAYPYQRLLTITRSWKLSRSVRFSMLLVLYIGLSSFFLN